MPDQVSCFTYSVWDGKFDELKFDCLWGGDRANVIRQEYFKQQSKDMLSGVWGPFPSAGYTAAAPAYNGFTSLAHAKWSSPSDPIGIDPVISRLESRGLALSLHYGGGQGRSQRSPSGPDPPNF
ncbi:hypothetical protein J6590_002877 [Homalodisca vitripennis]|nr:hypothetical protein J6590_002877 [Homalodisca vitripennis]